MPFLHWPFFRSIPELTPVAVLDILAVAFLFYQFFLIIRGRRAFAIITGVLMLVGIYVFAVVAGMGLLRTILETVAPYSVFALIVLFQSDIRRLLARMGRRRFLSGPTFDRREAIQEITLALETLSRNRTGALIVLERDIGLRTFIESGVMVDGVLSRDLLLSIFHPGTALHDGAVIIQGNRVAAAACFLPLSTNPRLMSTLGTRHRAAIGITEETDCLSIVVSEETGRISVAAFGDIQLNLLPEEVERRIAAHFGLAKESDAEAGTEITSLSPRDTGLKEARRP
ncbi:MAG TPA: TIGR00159 family protein [Bryobacterales bacterium]|nr:TIGR00159 family protein [Bryobacterales bacterium]